MFVCSLIFPNLCEVRRNLLKFHGWHYGTENPEKGISLPFIMLGPFISCSSIPWYWTFVRLALITSTSILLQWVSVWGFRLSIIINYFALGFSEIVGVFIGLYLILYTKRRWLWSGILSITAGSVAYLSWMIPNDCKLTRRWKWTTFLNLFLIFYFSVLHPNRRIGNAAMHSN